MKIKELRELNVQELKQKAAQLRIDFLHLRFQRANQQLKNPLKMRQVRREIARILTLIREKGAK